MVNFRIAAGLLLLLACVFLSGCGAANAPTDITFAGRNPAAVITNTGWHVVYVDPATRRLVHRGAGEPNSVSPAGDVIDLRGENAPLFAARPDGALLVVYPVKLGEKQKGTHRHVFGELRAQMSHDGGRTWSAPRRIDGDDTPRGHNFADLAVRPGGDVVVSWLDSRAGKQGVQAAVLRSDFSVSPAQTVDPRTCQCCRTALFASSNGNVWLAYRDLAENNVRNMAYAVSGRDQAFEMRGDVADDRWSVNGCPESGPRFAETSGGAVWLAWFNGGAAAIETAFWSAAAPPLSYSHASRETHALARDAVRESGAGETPTSLVPGAGPSPNPSPHAAQPPPARGEGTGLKPSAPAPHSTAGSFVRRAPVQGAVDHPDIGTLPDGRLVLVYEVFRDGRRSIEARTGNGRSWSNPIVLAPDGATPRYVRRGHQALLTYTTYAGGSTPHVRVMDPLPAIEGEAR